MHPTVRAMIEDVLEEGASNPVLFANCVAFALEIWGASVLSHAPQVIAALRRCTDIEAAKALLAETE